jgi:Kef-type K+ transport system membrane component KefB
MEGNLLVEIGIIIIVATLGGYIAKLLKQPLIPTYIIMGVILGPILHVIISAEDMLLLSEIGVAFLLFIVGLELDIRKLKSVGDIATIGGAIQCAFMFGAGYFASQLLGFGVMESIYLGIVVSFSSTMVVIKILSDKYELDSLHGRIVIGTLLLQDILAILALSMLNSGEGGATGLILNLVIGAAMIALSFLIGKWAFPPLFRQAAKSLELLFLLAVSVCFFFALIFTQLGFSHCCRRFHRRRHIG